MSHLHPGTRPIKPRHLRRIDVDDGVVRASCGIRLRNYNESLDDLVEGRLSDDSKRDFVERMVDAGIDRMVARAAIQYAGTQRKSWNKVKRYAFYLASVSQQVIDRAKTVDPVFRRLESNLIHHYGYARFIEAVATSPEHALIGSLCNPAVMPPRKHATLGHLEGVRFTDGSPHIHLEHLFPRFPDTMDIAEKLCSLWRERDTLQHTVLLDIITMEDEIESMGEHHMLLRGPGLPYTLLTHVEMPVDDAVKLLPSDCKDYKRLQMPGLIFTPA